LPALQERAIAAPDICSAVSEPHEKFVVQLCTAFFGLKDEAFGSEVLEDQDNS
jgi:hypothetical protein